MPIVALTKPQSFRYSGRVSFVPSTVVFEALINQASFSAQTLALTFDTVTVGAYTDIVVGQKVVIYSGATSTVKAVMRVAAGGATSTVLQVNEVSFPGEVFFANNDMIRIIAAFNPRELLVSNSVDFLLDSRVAAGSFPSDPPPVCNSGGPVVGDIDAGTSLLTASHDGSTSWRIDPDAGSITHAWAFGSGATPPTSTSATPSVTYPEGFWWATHALTDSNGTTTTQYVPVFAYGPSYRPLPVVMTSRDASLDQGFETVEFSVPRAYASIVLGMADNSLIVYDEAETRDGVTASYGSNVAGRSHEKFVGYLDSRSISISADGDTLTFTAIGPAGVLAKIGALSQVMKTGTTSKWGYFSQLSVWKALWYLLWRGSSIALVHDFILTDGADYLYSQLTIDNIASVKGQLDDLAASICTRLTSDAIGRLLMTRTLPFLTVAERAARTKTLDFTTALSVSVEWSEPMRPSVKLVTIDGITPGSSASSQTDVYGWAPGDAPGEGTDTASLDKQIGTTAQLYQRAGDEYRRLRGEYYDETTRAVRRVPMGLRLTVIGAADVVDPLLLEPVSITLPASTNTLGISFASTELWIVTDVSVSYDADAGTKTLTLTLDHETHGVTGKSRPNPNQSSTGVDPYLTDPIDFNPGGGILIPIYTPPVVSGAPTGKLFGVEETYNKAFATLDTGATWFLVGSGTITGAMIDACSDPYSYGRKFIITRTGLWRVDDPYGAPTVASLVASEATITGTAGIWPINIEMSINRKGYIAIGFGYHTIAYSFDYGATWARIPVDGSYVDNTNAGTAPHYGGVDIAVSPFNNPGASNQGWVWAVIGTYDGTIHYHYYLSKNWGVTWTLVTTTNHPGTAGPQSVYVPYKLPGGASNSNGTSHLVYGFGTQGLESVSAGGTVTVINSTSGGPRDGGGPHALNIYTLDATYLASATEGGGASPGNPHYFTSPDAGVTFTDIGAYATSSNHMIVGVTGWSSDPNILLLFGKSAIKVSADFGVTLTDISGNLTTLIGAGDWSPRFVGRDLVDVIPAS